MRWTVVASLVLLGRAPAVHAEDAPPVAPAPPPAAAAPSKPAPPPAPEQAADAVLAALAAKDDAALKALASRDEPDPWLVADELIRRGRHDDADAFAKAAPRVDVERLPEYVASRRGKPDDAERRARLARANAALAAREFAPALDTLGAAESGPIEDVVGVRLRMGRGLALAGLVRVEDAAAAFFGVGEAAEQLGWLLRARAAFNESGVVADRGGAPASALRAWERFLAVEERRGDRTWAALTMVNIGIDLYSLGDYAKALSIHARALAVSEESGDRQTAADALGNLGLVHQALGDYLKALRFEERALAAKEALGDRRGAAASLGTIGVIHYRLGDYARALLFYERSLAAKEALADQAGAARTLGNLGVVYRKLGDYAKALSFQERALEAAEALGDRQTTANALDNLGLVHHALGNYAKALSCHERALAASEALGDRAGAAGTLNNIGVVHRSLGDYARALLFYERSLAAKEAMGDQAGAARTLGNLGVVYSRLGDHAKALALFERALTSAEALGDRAGAAMTLGHIGVVHVALGDLASALAFARRAVRAQAQSVQGLSAEEGAGARGPLAWLYDVGGTAAVALKDASELSYFVESGRTGALLEGLSARDVLWSAAVPEFLRAEESKARASETRAVAALRKALDGGDLAATKARRAELEAAQVEVAAVVSRIQREAKAGAALVYPEAATLDEIRATLDAGDVLVLYALFEKEAAALVVEREGARIVTLGPRAPIDAAADAAAEALSDDASDPAAALRALADLVVKPLALRDGTKRVLVSPAGALSYVPFAALMPDRTVAYLPSGTTYRFLREEDGLRGEGVLALGDPDYETKVDERSLAVHRGAAGKLVRLPATRDEALAVGTTTLLGADATEAGLRKALAERKRWRAVHLACHGLVNTERPALSSLAITAAGDDDGFLTCLDVFRMKVPSDLVVLSACETGKGKVVRGEGIVGLTRAFMFAGSPRVLCSLWKVDDAATAALMTKFYELWNPKDGKPGLPTAEALRQAQEHVRSQENWKHPYYWAAWVLWGLPS
ncbi:MAG: tetratricopeptide repeat protein [Planctomycetes bacterium]|nr:tetratricopeptide repeat protein [Planctomycetota bacterium]